MKKALSILTLVSALFAVSIQQVSAQAIQRFPSDGTWITAAANGASNAPVGLVSIDVSGAKNVAIEWTCAIGGTDVTNVGVVFIPLAVDGSTRPSSPTTAYQFQMNRLSSGTTPIIVQTNFDTLGFQRLDLYYMTNNSATLIMSNQFRYRLKRGL